MGLVDRRFWSQFTPVPTIWISQIIEIQVQQTLCQKCTVNGDLRPALIFGLQSIKGRQNAATSSAASWMLNKNSSTKLDQPGSYPQILGKNK